MEKIKKHDNLIIWIVSTIFSAIMIVAVSLLTKKPSAEITEEFEKAKAYTE